LRIAKVNLVTGTQDSAPHEIGDKITVFDDDGASRTYYVFDTLFLPNGSNYFVYEGRIAPTGETITLQTCTGDNQRVRCVMAR
ncbi:MAG: hypothetical protein ACLTDR_04920, partial [Adlercreutzia equolifaciens]